jgi:hypothetical protein
MGLNKTTRSELETLSNNFAYLEPKKHKNEELYFPTSNFGQDFTKIARPIFAQIQICIRFR